MAICLLCFKRVALSVWPPWLLTLDDNGYDPSDPCGSLGDEVYLVQSRNPLQKFHKWTSTMYF